MKIMLDEAERQDQTYLKVFLVSFSPLTHSIDVLRPMSLAMEAAQKVRGCDRPPLSLPADPHASQVESTPLRV
jgi:hypothetical protein